MMCFGLVGSDDAAVFHSHQFMLSCVAMCKESCLVHPKILIFFKIFRHIKSLDINMNIKYRKKITNYTVYV